MYFFSFSLSFSPRFFCRFLFQRKNEKCWGLNTFGQLGLGDNRTRGDENDVSGMDDNLHFVDLGVDETVEAMGLGASHACAILTGGSLKVPETVL